MKVPIIYNKKPSGVWPCIVQDGSYKDDFVACLYGFDRIPRRLKKYIKKRFGTGLIAVFTKPDSRQEKDPGFIWLECFKTLL